MRTNISLAFHGAARSTTGSRHLLTVDDHQILLDCGLYQGRRKETWERNLNFGFAPRAVRAVVLSHAHLDHCGNLPNLVKQGFAGKIFCTAATNDICRYMLRDSAHIQEKDAEFISRRRQRKGTNGPVSPLYTIEDAEQTFNYLEAVHYHRTFDIVDEVVQGCFYDAGHILGSAAAVIEIRRGERLYRLGFSGDIGRVGMPILRDPEVPHRLDWLIMEGTYGGRLHADIGDAKEELRETIERTAKRGGKVIIPSFSLGRTQEVVYYLHQLTDEGLLPPIPVFVDSPLAVNLTEVFRLHADSFDRETREWIVRDPDPFGFNRLTYIRDVEESMKLNTMRTPCVIISASGMCEAGRILHHLHNSIEDPRNTVMIVGYQAADTLGRKIVERQPEVNIFGEPHRLRAEVVTLNAMSGHADKNNLFEYARTVKEASPDLKEVFLVHGEPDGLSELGGRLRTELGLNVTIPELGERHFLEE